MTSATQTINHRQTATNANRNLTQSAMEYNDAGIQATREGLDLRAKMYHARADAIDLLSMVMSGFADRKQLDKQLDQVQKATADWKHYHGVK